MMFRMFGMVEGMTGCDLTNLEASSCVLVAAYMIRDRRRCLPVNQLSR